MTTCKVDTVRDEYTLYNVDSRLVHRYESTDTELQGVEAWLNKQVLRRAIERTDESVLDGKEENLFRLLTRNEVMDSARSRSDGFETVHRLLQLTQSNIPVAPT